MEFVSPNEVVFTADSYMDVRQWVQDRSTYQEIVATASRLYLPIRDDTMVAVAPGEVIRWNPDGGSNAFTVEHLP